MGTLLEIPLRRAHFGNGINCTLPRFLSEADGHARKSLPNDYAVPLRPSKHPGESNLDNNLSVWTYLYSGGEQKRRVVR